MTESQRFDGEHCPQYGAEIEIGENANYVTVLTYPDCGRWGRMTFYVATAGPRGPDGNTGGSVG